MQKILIEHLNPSVAKLSEQQVGGQMYLNGIMMQAELINGNGEDLPSFRNF